MNFARVHAGGPLVDFTRVQKVIVDVETPDDIYYLNDLIKVTTHLDKFKIMGE